MECMCAQTRPQFTLSSEKVLGDGVRIHVNYKRAQRRVDHIMQDSESNTLGEATLSCFLSLSRQRQTDRGAELSHWIYKSPHTTPPSLPHRYRFSSSFSACSSCSFGCIKSCFDHLGSCFGGLFLVGRRLGRAAGCFGGRGSRGCSCTRGGSKVAFLHTEHQARQHTSLWNSHLLEQLQSAMCTITKYTFGNATFLTILGYILYVI